MICSRGVRTFKSVMTKLTAAMTAIALLFSYVTITAALPVVTVSGSPAITVVGADPAEQTRLDEALVRFRDNGLHLPDLEVHFLDESGCLGHLGFFQEGFRPWRILLCSDLDFVPTHELAHAWVAANLDESDQDRYIGVRDLTHWSDKNITRSERGEEDAAFMVQQNLMAANPQLTSRAWQDRLAAYELLTGRPSPLAQATGHMTAGASRHI